MHSRKDDTSSLPGGTTLYRFNGVPVVAQPGFWPLPFLLAGILAWIAGLRRPQRSWPQRLGVGLLAMAVALPADIGHAMAHTVGARLAGAPMDEILLSAGMPRTLYVDNDVPPRTHILRSLGGPVFSLVGFLLSLLWRRSTRPETLNRDLADASLAGHSFILLGSLTPLPIVDGGIILKWLLVEAGQSVAQADQTVNNTNIGLGAGLVGLGAVLAMMRPRRLLGALLAAGGAVGIAAGLGWLK